MAINFKTSQLILTKQTVTASGNSLYVNGIELIAGVSGNIIQTGQVLYNDIVQTSGSLANTGQSLYNYILGTSGSLGLTGQTLYTYVTTTSGAIGSTGTALYNDIIGLSGIVSSVKITGSSIQNNLNFTGVGTSQIWISGTNVYISGNNSDAINLSGNLAQTGATLITRDTNISGAIATQLVLTGQILYGNDIALSGSLANTGQSLYNDILNLSGIIGYAGNYVFTTGSQVITGPKTFTNVIALNSGITSNIHIVGLANYTPISGDYIILFTGSPVSVTGILPNATNYSGTFFTIINGTNAVLQISGIIGPDTNPLLYQYDALEVYATSGQWNYIQRTGSPLTAALIANSANLSGSIGLTGQTLYNNIIATSGSLASTGQVLYGNVVATSGSLALTGQVLYNNIVATSGSLANTGQVLYNNIVATSGSLANTGQALYNDIINLSGIIGYAGNYVFTTGNQIISGPKTFTNVLGLNSGFTTAAHYVGLANYTLTSGDYIVIFTGSPTNITGILPAIGSYSGTLFTLINNTTGPLQTSGIIGPDINPILSQYESIEVYGASGVWNYLGKQTGNIATITYVNNVSGAILTQLTISGQTLFNNIIATSGSLATTGQTLYNYILGTSGSLALTGSNLQGQINALSGYNAPALANYVYISGAQFISGAKTFLSELRFNSGLKTPERFIGAANYSIISGDYIIVATGAVTNVTGILPTISDGSYSGTLFTILNARTIGLPISGIIGPDINPILAPNDAIQVYGGSGVWHYIRQTGSPIWADSNNNAINLSGNLQSTGQILYNYLTVTSGAIGVTGTTLYNDIIGLSGQLNTSYAPALAQYVYLTGAQTITGTKGFNTGIVYNTLFVGQSLAQAQLVIGATTNNSNNASVIINSSTNINSGRNLMLSDSAGPAIIFDPGIITSSTGGIYFDRPTQNFNFGYFGAGSFQSFNTKVQISALSGWIGVGTTPQQSLHASAGIRADTAFYSGATNISDLFYSRVNPSGYITGNDSLSGWANSVFVHRTGDEYVSGNKTFNSLFIATGLSINIGYNLGYFISGSGIMIGIGNSGALTGQLSNLILFGANNTYENLNADFTNLNATQVYGNGNSIFASGTGLNGKNFDAQSSVVIGYNNSLFIPYTKPSNNGANDIITLGRTNVAKLNQIAGFIPLVIGTQNTLTINTGSTSNNFPFTIVGGNNSWTANDIGGLLISQQGVINDNIFGNANNVNITSGAMRTATIVGVSNTVNLTSGLINGANLIGNGNTISKANNVNFANTNIIGSVNTVKASNLGSASNNTIVGTANTLSIETLPDGVTNIPLSFALKNSIFGNNNIISGAGYLNLFGYGLNGTFSSGVIIGIGDTQLQFISGSGIYKSNTGDWTLSGLASVAQLLQVSGITASSGWADGIFVHRTGSEFISGLKTFDALLIKSGASINIGSNIGYLQSGSGIMLGINNTATMTGAFDIPIILGWGNNYDKPDPAGSFANSMIIGLNNSIGVSGIQGIRDGGNSIIVGIGNKFNSASGSSTSQNDVTIFGNNNLINYDSVGASAPIILGNNHQYTLWTGASSQNTNNAIVGANNGILQSTKGGLATLIGAMKALSVFGSISSLSVTSGAANNVSLFGHGNNFVVSSGSAGLVISAGNINTSANISRLSNSTASQFVHVGNVTTIRATNAIGVNNNTIVGNNNAFYQETIPNTATPLPINFAQNNSIFGNSNTVSGTSAIQIFGHGINSFLSSGVILGIGNTQIQISSGSGAYLSHTGNWDLSGIVSVAQLLSTSGYTENNFVHRIGNETISGDKTFTGNHYITSGNVGIGTINPVVTLDVSGTIKASNIIGSAFNGAQLAGTRNRIINGDFMIAQRAPTGTFATTAAAYFADRWRLGNIMTGTYTGRRVSTSPPSGFSYYFNYFNNNPTASGIIPATDKSTTYYGIEGSDIQDFAYGTSNAQIGVLSFWVNAGLAATYGAAFQNSDQTYSFPFQYIINNPNTWEYKTVIIPGASGGNWYNNETGGMLLRFDLGCGSNFKAPFNGAWLTGSYISPSGVTTYPRSAAGGVWNLAGVQFERGTVATPYEYKTYAEALKNCERYCEVLSAGDGVTTSSAYTPFGMGIAYNTTNSFVQFPFRTRKRVGPTVTISNNSDFGFLGAGGGIIAITSFSNNYTSFTSASADIGIGPSTWVTLTPAYLLANNSTNARIIFDAEL